MNTPRKKAIAAIAKQIESEAGRVLSTAYIVSMLQKTVDGGYYVEYRGKRYDGETVEKITEESAEDTKNRN